MASQKFCVGTQNFKFVCTIICGYSKSLGTCTQNLNFVGTQICGYSKLGWCSKFILLKICRTHLCGYSKNNRRYSNLLVFILKIVLILKIRGTIIKIKI